MISRCYLLIGFNRQQGRSWIGVWILIVHWFEICSKGLYHLAAFWLQSRLIFLIILDIELHWIANNSLISCNICCLSHKFSFAIFVVSIAFIALFHLDSIFTLNFQGLVKHGAVVVTISDKHLIEMISVFVSGWNRWRRI